MMARHALALLTLLMSASLPRVQAAAPAAASAAPAASAAVDAGPKLPPPPPGMFAPPGRGITHVAGDLYRANNGGWYVAVLVTPAGIVLVDTLNTDFARWLKQALAERFPGKPVKYVIYSHSHWDHAEGGRVFADTATFIGQEGMLRNMDGRYPALPGDIVDRNEDGRLDIAEFEQPFLDRLWYCGSTRGAVTSKDTEHRGSITPAQFFADIVKPDIVYSERMTLRFGGKTLELVFPGKNHASDGTAVLFKDERVLFAVDFPADALVQASMRSLPSACGPFDGHPMAEWIKSYRTLEALDFELLVGGHGTVAFHKQDISEGREYFEYLQREVEGAMSRGLSLAQMREQLTLDRYKDWAHYAQLRAFNIEAAYRNLRLYR